MKRQANRGQREVEEWKKDRVMLSTKKRPVKKLIEQYVEPYIIKVVVSKNTIKFKLLTFIRIHLMVNFSIIVRYREPVKSQ